MGASDCVFDLMPCVMTIDCLKRMVVGGLCAILDDDRHLLVDFRQFAQQAVGHAVGACADDNACHERILQSLVVELAELV